jgi:tRNA(His) guanylyltransferase
VDNDSFEAEQRAGECYHQLRLDGGKWVVVRVDGRSFSAFTRDHYEKPFDLAMSHAMRATSLKLVEELGAVLAYTESDEISVLLPMTWDMFDRRVEKLISVSAGIASATFSITVGEPAHFDSRIWVGDSIDDVVAYFSWRQTDAARCALNGWCYWTLRKHGATERQASRQLERASTEDKIALLARYGIVYSDVPLWQRLGVLVSRKIVDHVGHNPITGENIAATRRRLVIDEELPAGEGFRTMIERLAIAESARSVLE